MAGSIFIPLVSVFDGKGIRQAQTQMSGLAGVLKNLKTTAAAAAASFATIKSLQFIQESVVVARDLERSMYGLDAIFGETSATMKQFAIDAEAIGLSQLDAANASTFLGSVLKQSNMPMEEVITRTKDLVGLAADLSAVYKYDVSEALTGMTAIFRGEYDPIEKFGVAMKQNEVNALLAERGQNKLTGAALKYATAVAKIDLLLGRSQDAQGAYAAQQGSMYVAQKNLTASFLNLKGAVGASLTGPLATLLSAVQPLVEQFGTRLTPIFEIFAQVVELLTPLLQPMSDLFLTIFDAISPLIDVLISLIKPLMVPLVEIFKALIGILKPFIPVIEFVARALGAILVPVLTVLSFVLTMALKALNALIEGLASIPFIGDFFKSANAELKTFTDGMNGLNDKLLETKTSGNGLITELSKDIPSNSIDNATKATDDLTASLKKSSDAMSDLIDDAKNVQKSLISAFDITGVLQDNSQEIFESIVFVNGKFKTIVSSVAKGSTDVASAFAKNLDKMKTFYKNIQQLFSLNLDPELIQQIVSAGPETGNATAEAILASGAESVKGLNKTFTGIRKLAGNVGAKLAETMQTNGERMGNGLIDGLVAKRDSLIAQAAKIGESAGATLGKKFIDEANRLGIQSLKLEVSDTTFVGTQVAGLGADNSLMGKKPTLMAAGDIVNPFSSNTAAYKRLEEFKQKANNYNISINVAPGANGPSIGKALVAAIKQYERVTGKG